MNYLPYIVDMYERVCKNDFYRTNVQTLNIMVEKDPQILSRSMFKILI